MRSIVVVSFASGQFGNAKDKKKEEKPHKMYSCHHCFVGGIFFFYLCSRCHIAMQCKGNMRSDHICHGHELRISEWKYWPENIIYICESFFLVTISYCDELPHFCTFLTTLCAALLPSLGENPMWRHLIELFQSLCTF